MNTLFVQLRGIELAVVFTSWFAFAGIFLFRKKPPRAAAKESERKSYVGVALQGMGYALVWGIRRPYLSPFATMPAAMEVAVSLLVLALMAAGVWITLAAVQTLGKEWSFQARLIEGHRLVTNGPYRLVRNPIYAGMLWMLVGTGLGISYWSALLGGLALFLIGARIRIRSEEALLRGAFGTAFDDYARRVPALIPGLW